MRFAVCTLYEGHYHCGVAALINSLYTHGFRGSIFVGFRGQLPPWFKTASPGTKIYWPHECHTHKVHDDLDVHFLTLDTSYHLTNYKATFIMDLFSGPASQMDGISYFDPDIVIKCRWSFFENWMKHGVSLVHEIVANDLPSTHPVRLEWEQVIRMTNKTNIRKINSYINGGFCGILKSNIEFVETWAEIINLAIVEYGCDSTKFSSFDRSYPFWSIDQDAINITAMCSDSPISESGPEGMDFIHGGWTMSHATGTPKPWKKNFLWAALHALPPTLAEKAFWLNIDGPIKPISSARIRAKLFSIKLAAFIGRFYRRY